MLCENRKGFLLEVLVLIGKGKRVCLHAEQESLVLEGKRFLLTKRLVIKGNNIYVKQEYLS